MSTSKIYFDGIPKEATCSCSPSFPSAFLVLPQSSDSDDNNDDVNARNSNDDKKAISKIEIGQLSQVVMNRNALLVGRQASTCDIRITHKSLSRQHALLYYYHDDDDNNNGSSATPPHLYIYDLETKSGTFVNHERNIPKTPIRLHDGDTVQFGKAQPTFTIQWSIDDAVETKVNPTATEKANGHDLQIGDRNENGIREEKSQDVDPTAGLTGRAKRQAEIAAMMASLEEIPTYTKYVPSTDTNSKITNESNIGDGSIYNVLKSKKGIVEKHRLPFTEATVMAHIETSHISAAIIDPTGGRFAIGSMDSSLKLYDFGGYNPDDPIPFQNIIIEDGYPIRSIAYSPTADKLIIGTGSAQPQIVDRDGQEIIKFVRGDVYVTDPSKTIGHTATVTSVAWHPLEKSIVFTTSRDGSLRSWNIDKGKLSFSMLSCSDVVVIKNLKTGRKTIPTCMSISSNNIAMGTECGSLQFYKYPFVSKLRPQQSVRVISHDQKDEPVSCVVYSTDASRVATRTKTTVKIWNVASRLSTSSLPWMWCENVPIDDTDSSTPTLAFSPNGKLLCVATSSIDDNSKKFSNHIQIFVVPKEAKNKSSSPILSLPILDDNNIGHLQYPILGLSWHIILNQILLTTTQGFQIWYSTEWSKKGILLTSKRRRKRKLVEDELQDLYASRAPPPGSAVREEEIITPNALPLFGGDKHKRSKKQRGEEEHEEILAKKIPQKPAKGVYNTQNTMFTQMIMDNRTSTQKKIAGMDPREALAAYNEGKSYIGVAYEGNVERILADKTMEEEEEEKNKRKKKS